MFLCFWLLNQSSFSVASMFGCILALLSWLCMFFLACGWSRSIRLAFVLVIASIWAILQLVEHISTLGCSISPNLHLSLIFLFHWHALGWLRFWVVTSCKSHETSWVSKEGVPTGVWGGLLVSVGAYWCLWMPTDVWGCLMVSGVVYWYLMVPMGAWRCLLVSEGA